MGSNAGAAFDDVAPLHLAGPSHVAFLDNRKYVDAFRTCRAGACIVAPALAEQAPPGMALLVSARPYWAYALVAQAFHPEPEVAAAVHPSAIIDSSARLGEGCRVDAGAVIGAHAEIGAGCQVGANAVIGPSVIVGDGSSIGAGATLSHCLVGKRALIHPGVRIGQRGFGFAIDGGRTMKVPQLGRVLIGDDVEIGANTTIDRGSGPDTVIGDGCMIDNLVQIGHNVELGRGCIVVAQAGIAGSAHLGDGVAVAAQAGIVGHLRIGNGARIAAQSGVMREVADGESVCGSPAVPVREFFRQVVAVSRLAKRGDG